MHDTSKRDGLLAAVRKNIVIIYTIFTVFPNKYKGVNNRLLAAGLR